MVETQSVYGKCGVIAAHGERQMDKAMDIILQCIGTIVMSILALFIAAIIIAICGIPVYKMYEAIISAM